MPSPTAAYGQYCPIARALDLLGERWSLLILRDLLLGSTRFNDLSRGLPGLSRSLLAKRLRQFERAGLVEKVGLRYVPTQAGLDLEPVLFGLAEWGASWSFGAPDPAELDADLLVWWMHTRLDTTGLPGLRQVFAVRFTDDARRYWIVVDRGAPSVCVTDPGFPVDVTIRSDVASLYQVWLGRLPIGHAQRTGRLEFLGPPALTRRMSTILRLSPVAPYSATPLRMAETA
ncbi:MULTISPECIES: winged helix-turn-helix transcriptional regulator [Nocardia]|uniref:winged helix-turn-helix transcriptional regulator n=1 Tax=Nocardia TaxID=1817 RepID=UPI000BF11A5D|nr:MULTISPECIES: winged helix-turn-helix transcriptional regulator [Nocardia]MBF6184458.1 transcriptional regulator [Nocardia farcinica]MBF6290432.1 transcriptional regulator [Nocardia farcinica]MBF6310302.1 transcriptional regulator [Nocardia farcinica]MBF6377605.1 transcriptional regulator [Nocardia farcinica]MBF6405878.1 transcriptional regulator [Nocardia farcinica]